MTSSEWTWKSSTTRDGCLVYRLRSRELDRVEAFAARCLQTEDELMDDLLARARRPLADDSLEPELPLSRADEQAVARLAVGVGEAAEERRMKFVADVGGRAVYGPSGKPIRGAWQMFAAYCTERGLRPDRLEDDQLAIRNARGDVVIRAAPR